MLIDYLGVSLMSDYGEVYAISQAYDSLSEIVKKSLKLLTNIQKKSIINWYANLKNN